MDDARERLYLQRIAEEAAERAQETVSLQEQVQQLRGQLTVMAGERDDLLTRITAIETQSAPAEEQPPAAV